MAVASIAAACVAASSAHAGFPALTVQWKLNGGTVLADLPIGIPNGMGGYGYVGGHSVGSVSMTYSLVGFSDHRISGNFTLENFTLETVEVELLVTLPVAPSVSAPSSLTGSVAVGMTADADGGNLAVLPGVPFWQGLIDGTAAGDATDLLSDLAGGGTVASLTPRQREVLQLLAEGHSMRQVADILEVTPRTVAFHKYRLMNDLKLKNNAELVQFAIKHRIVSTGPSIEPEEGDHAL